MAYLLFCSLFILDGEGLRIWYLIWKSGLHDFLHPALALRPCDPSTTSSLTSMSYACIMLRETKMHVSMMHDFFHYINFYYHKVGGEGEVGEVSVKSF